MDLISIPLVSLLQKTMEFHIINFLEELPLYVYLLNISKQRHGQDTQSKRPHIGLVIIKVGSSLLSRKLLKGFRREVAGILIPE